MRGQPNFAYVDLIDIAYAEIDPELFYPGSQETADALNLVNPRTSMVAAGELLVMAMDQAHQCGVDVMAVVRCFAERLSGDRTSPVSPFELPRIQRYRVTLGDA